MLRATTACTFSTSQLPKVVRSSSVLSILTWKCASRHNGVHFSMSHLASWLRTRRFSEPTFRPSGATNHWKNTVNRDFPIFSRIYLFFLLIFSLLTLFTSAFQLSILSEVSLLNFLRSFPIHQISWFYLSSQWKSPGPASKAMIPGASIREICTRNKRRDSINQSIDLSFIYRLICILYVSIMQPYVYIYTLLYDPQYIYEISNQYVGIVSMFIFVHLFVICILYLSRIQAMSVLPSFG